MIHSTVSVYTASHSADASATASYYSLLSAEEKEHSNKFLQLKAGLQFVFRRAMLKKVLSHFLGEAPEKILFNKTVTGKPILKDHASVQFSCSASGDNFLCAVTNGVPVGADIETISPDQNHPLIAARYFSADENKLLTLPVKGYTDTFFALWTRREAYLKLTGTGWKGNSPDAILLTPELFSKTPAVIPGLSTGDNKEYKVISYNEENCIISVMVQTPQENTPEFVFLPF